MHEFGVEQCIYGHLHGMTAWENGIKGEYGGVDYRLVSLDYLGARPKLIYDSEFGADDKAARR